MFKYVFLGIIQGITEFLPVSSSGHLVIMQKVLGINGKELELSIILHLGTCLSLIFFFFKDILNTLRNIKFLSLIITATFITGIIGILGRDLLERLFTLPQYVAIGLFFTGIILIITKKFMVARRNSLTQKDAVILGFSQGLAIVPGISRSGLTISTLLFRGIDRSTSFNFSFIASLPAILGATILEAKRINFALEIEPQNFIVGFIFSFISGILSLWVLRIILNKAKLFYFGYYCIVAAVFILLFVR